MPMLARPRWCRFHCPGDENNQARIIQMMLTAYEMFRTTSALSATAQDPSPGTIAQNSKYFNQAPAYLSKRADRRPFGR